MLRFWSFLFIHNIRLYLLVYQKKVSMLIILSFLSILNEEQGMKTISYQVSMLIILSFLFIDFKKFITFIMHSFDAPILELFIYWLTKINNGYKSPSFDAPISELFIYNEDDSASTENEKCFDAHYFELFIYNEDDSASTENEKCFDAHYFELFIYSEKRNELKAKKIWCPDFETFYLSLCFFFEEIKQLTFQHHSFTEPPIPKNLIVCKMIYSNFIYISFSLFLI